jgi:GNAT superfamily N-acetyltransferase
MEPLRPRPATLNDLAHLIDTIELAFASDPVWGPMLSIRGDRDQARLVWRLWIEGALRYPWVWMTPAAEAVAVWIPPGATELSREQETTFESRAIEALGPDRAAHLTDVMALFAAAHPQGQPHYYLSLLGTHPAHRGRGIGMKLLADNLATIDRDGRPAYLESTNPLNNQRYRNVGFAPIGEFRLPGDGPVVTTMWRPGHNPVG